MSQTGVFLTSTFSKSDQPSFFEVSAEQGLAKIIPEALGHLLRYISDWSTSAGKLLQYQDEIFLILNGTLQLHYLKVHNSSFTENFYGLERFSSIENSPKIKIRHSWIGLVILPYLRQKLERIFIKLREEEADNKPGKYQKYRRLFVQLYPYLHLALDSMDIGFLLNFSLSRDSKHHSFLSYLIGYHLINLTPERAKEKSRRIFEDENGKSGLSHLVSSSISKFSTLLTFCLKFGSFFLQFLDWWYNRPTEHVESESLDTIPPPPPPVTQSQGGGTCPLCRRRRVGDTVAPVSGLVFCYSCIVLHVRAESKCPVTGLPLSEEDLVRIYPPGDE